MKLSFHTFDGDSLQATEAAWKSEFAEAGIFPAELEQVFDWTRGRIALTNNEVAYGIFAGGKDADAIVEVVVHRRSVRSKTIKLLRLRLRPRLEARIYAQDIAAYQHALDCYLTAFSGVVKLGKGDRTATLKFYGRSQEQLDVLKALVAPLQQRAKGHNFRMDGRWLVIEPIKAD